ncbi:MAG: ectoine hydroxylase [Bacillota bacterium]|uniref:Ectoine hydroxylase n=1 Tax=Virgibacillus salarius TaxID=447199 RepID=A0A941DRZ5_9BACI|nr:MULTISPECIES: ectoine hydroxylase [Bacillaceae]NAZ07338.1 ectoine hydroxylase [Agaribacter marinus]MBR7794616.1 ectoine hydroxylase [Virgibacillus salarius]MCC2250908.1 ectoine hydroxylase [Virgibacillus sp. AGTR]MDY7044752.1 ectoine hydroxylase [Virgibacillus sp. M23]QRZ16358.1 ectoine hydroxylase [Virgibacillus sp. AGTR]
MEDLYPSRQNNRPEILKRKDPVIYTDRSKDNQAPITKEQLDSYEKNGFLQIKNFFSDKEVVDMQKAIFELQKSHHNVSSDKIIREPESDEIRSIFHVHHDDNYFKNIANDKRLLDIVEYLLGSGVYIHQSRINYKPGFKGKEFDWHSDFETWHVEDGMPRMRAISVSIALSDNYSFNGPLMLIPGSHNFYVSCVGDTPEDNYKKSLKKQKLGVPDENSLRWLCDKGGGITAPTGKAGAVTLFESNTMHGSSSNMTPYPRNNLFMVYNSIENRLVEPFSGGKERPEYIAVRQNELSLSG